MKMIGNIEELKFIYLEKREIASKIHVLFETDNYIAMKSISSEVFFFCPFLGGIYETIIHLRNQKCEG